MAAAAFLFRRELRGEKGLFVFAALTMMVATAALTLVLSLAHSFEASLEKQSRALLGGDVNLRLSQREFSADEIAWLQDNAAAVSEMRAVRALAAVGERTQLVRIKAVDEQYPLFGELPLANPLADAPVTAPLFTDPATQGGIHAAYIAQDLATLLELQTGDTFTAGGLTLRVENLVLVEPDPDPRLWAGAPLVLVAKRALLTDAFTRPGALVGRNMRVRLPAEVPLAAWQERLQSAFPDAGWRVRTPENAQGGVQRLVKRVRDFLALASLAAVLLAGIGCGNALSAFLRARMRSIAVVKMVGGSAALIRRVYLMLAALFAVGGALLGALLGKAAMFALVPLLAALLPTPLQAEWSTAVFLRALLAAAGMSAAFAIPPILRFARINPLSLFAAESSEDRTPAADWIDRLIMAAAFTLVAFALPLEWDEKALLLGIVALAAILYVQTLAFAAVAQRIATRLPLAVRLGLLSIARNRRQSAAAVVSFGVGLCVLMATLNTEGNFSARIDDTLRQQAPALFFIGIAPEERATLREIVAAHSTQASVRMIPFVRGRVQAIAGTPASEIKAEGEEWILRGDRGLTWTDGDYIGGSYVTAGKLWDESIPGLQASFDEEAAIAFGVELGEELELNILGERVTAVISSFREIEWQSFDINFAILLSQMPIADLPHTYMGGAYLAQPGSAGDLQKKIYNALPNIVPINTTTVFDVMQQMLLRAAALLQATALFLMVAGVPMILATLLENRRRRLATVTTLRLLGAPRRVVVAAGFAEFAVMALLTLLPAVLLAALGGWVMVTTIFELEWQAHWQQFIAVAAAGALAFLLIGTADIARAARQAPFALLRNE